MITTHINISVGQLAEWARAKPRRLTLDPPYQRKPVWTIKQRSALIETLLLDLPVPEIFTQVRMTAEGHAFHVIVDGQQRIRSILKFLGIDDGDDEDIGFALDLDDPLSPYQGISFFELDDEVKVNFYSKMLNARQIDSSVSRDEIKDLFKRFNKYLLPLTPQELRNAAFDGPLVRLSNQLADDPFWVSESLVTPQAVRRMKDVEFVSDLLIGIMYGPQAGNAATLDRFYRQLEAFDELLPQHDAVVQRFSSTLTLIRDMLGGLRGTRWGNRTDFYSLFVALAEADALGRALRGANVKQLAQRLEAFAESVNVRLGNEDLEAAKDVIAYVRAVEKGASDRSRRLARHEIILALIEPYLDPKKS